MTRLPNVPGSPTLSHIRNARSYPEQTAALRALKNEVIGHVQKKEACISNGVLEPIVKILAATRSPAKMNGKDSRFHAGVSARSLTDEEAVRLQALQLLASFANGGAPFLPPLHAAGSLPAILANICPFTNPPQIVLAALRTLMNVAEAADRAAPQCPIDAQLLADNIFTPHHIESLNSILASPTSNTAMQPMIELAASLISRLCQEESHQFALANAGVLDSLGARLASFGVAEGLVIPGAELIGPDSMTEFIPEPAPRGASLAVILEAVSVIVGDSRFRACMLLCSPAIIAVFPATRFNPSREARAPWEALEATGLGHPPHQNLSAMDYLLPAVPMHHGRGLAAFPPLGSTDVRENTQSQPRSPMPKFGSGNGAWDSSKFEPFAPSADADLEDMENPLIPWLEYLVRSRQDRERLVAASVLTSLFKAGFGSKSLRETSLGLLVVPVLLELLSTHSSTSISEPATISNIPLAWTVLERTPAVLARLITDSEFLQKAAFECDAVKILSKLLKDAYEPISASSQAHMWSPNSENGMDVDAAPNLCKLGPPAGPPLLEHRIRVRESVLKAIGALAAGKDDYRKAFVDQDIVPLIVESLSQTPGKPKPFKERTKSDKAKEETAAPDPNSLYGTNPLSVIIAACHVVRMLSRSVSILRTALVDYGVAMPMFRFLRHPDVEVQIAATAAICNLVLEVSPMREPLTEAGVLKVLCEHAKSLNPSLRLNALWALKHFVNAVGSDLKKSCLEELQSGWLVQLISTDMEDALFSAREKTNKQGGMLDNEMDEDVEMEQADEQRRSWFFPAATPPQDFDGKRSVRMRQAEAKLAALRDSELNPVRKARNDDLAIQEQGLDFIRNLIGEPWGTSSGSATTTSSETTEMIDYLFQELGQDRLFEILASKLRPRPLSSFSRRPGSVSVTTLALGRERKLYPQAKIIAAVIYILVHMAASLPRHRQIVIAQTDLLRLGGQHFGSKDKEVRLALCFLVSNLTLLDDPADAQACAARAHELVKLGFGAKVEALEKEDSELQVKEQAKTASWQMKQFSYPRVAAEILDRARWALNARPSGT